MGVVARLRRNRSLSLTRQPSAPQHLAAAPHVNDVFMHVTQAAEYLCISTFASRDRAVRAYFVSK